MFKATKHKGKIKFEKLWCTKMGDLPQTTPPTFKLLELDGKIFGIGRYKKYTKSDKNWGSKMGVPHKRGPPKFKLFNLLSWAHEI